MKNVIVQARWRRSQIAETFASVRVSAPCYSFAEYVGFFPIVESELELRQVERQVLLAYVVIRADDSTFQQRPERINALSVNLSAHILASRMRNGLMRHHPSDVAITAMLIRGDQFHFVADNFADESSQCFGICAFDHLADHVSLASYCADYWCLTSGSTSGLLLIPMAIAVLSADVGFVHFYDPHQLTELWIAQTGAQAMAHIPSRAVRTGTDHPMDLKRTDSLLTGQHQVQNFEPDQQRLLAFFENRSRLEREAVRRTIVLAALFALPVRQPNLARIDVIVLATRAPDAVRPAARVKIFAAGFLIWKHLLELSDGHLPNDLRLACLNCLVHRHDRNHGRISRGSQVQHTSPREGVRG